MVPSKILEILACPICKTKVDLPRSIPNAPGLQPRDEGKVWEAERKTTAFRPGIERGLPYKHLICNRCGSTYQIENDIPVMLANSSRTYWQDYYEKHIEIFGDSVQACDYIGKFALIIEQYGILKVIGKQKDSLILDVGCGNGLFSKPLSGNNEIIGIDISLEMLKYARKRNILAIQADANSFPILSNTFDLILCIEMVQYLDNIEFILAEIVRVMKPGCKIILSTVNPLSIIRKVHRLFEGKYRQIKMWKAEEIIRILKKKGLKNLECIYNYYPFAFNIPSAIDSIHRFLASVYIIKAKK